jgi:hypothetical protein
MNGPYEDAELEAAEQPDASHDLDMETVFASDAHNAEMLALEVQSFLEAQGIPTLLLRGAQIASLPCEVRVPRSRLEEARAVLAAAEESGPEAAAEAERQFEAAGGSENPE